MASVTEDYEASTTDILEEAPPLGQQLRGLFHNKWFVAGFVATLALVAVFSVYWVRYWRLIDVRLRDGAFVGTASIYAAPRSVAPGEEARPADIVAELTRAGYSENPSNPLGHYKFVPGGVAIYPGSQSYFSQDPAVVTFAKGKIARIALVRDGQPLKAYNLEPQLITSMSEKNRERRRIVPFAELPAVLVQAVISAEDKRFFTHIGLDPVRIAKAAWVDIREGRKEQGASTLSMQLARNLWLDQDKEWSRKFAEAMITLLLELRLSKEQIFEDYANQIYLGRSGTFNVHGFGEAAWAYFGKDVRKLTLTEAATLAGLIQRPGYFNPFRNGDRLLERRNIVLMLMRDNGYITPEQYKQATSRDLGLNPGESAGSEIPYSIDLVYREFQDRIAKPEQVGRIYTTVDLRLQEAAVEAIKAGAVALDKTAVKKNGVKPQIALVALDPRTGEVKALVGGRDYSKSQLNRAVAMRPPGSAFKPFVFAAALNSAVRGGQIVTAATTVDDEPTTFDMGRGQQAYQPGNFGDKFFGQLTLRRALAHSANIAAIKVGQLAGFRNVVELARASGFNDKLQPTPSIALGAYETTPLELAGAYTTFANNGVHVKPAFISAVRGRDGDLLYSHRPETRSVLTPAVNYLIVNMMEEVMRSGTAAGARSKGFTVPAAGKTGTSRDGWFAGFTSDLLAVVWVGYDDYSDLGIEGSKSALPIWTEFMKRATKIYGDPKPFRPPSGVTSVEICSESGQRPTDACPRRAEYFVNGTAPGATCELHGYSYQYMQVGMDIPRRTADGYLPQRTPRPLPAQETPLPRRTAQLPRTTASPR